MSSRVIGTEGTLCESRVPFLSARGPYAHPPLAAASAYRSVPRTPALGAWGRDWWLSSAPPSRSTSGTTAGLGAGPFEIEMFDPTAVVENPAGRAAEAR